MTVLVTVIVIVVVVLLILGVVMAAMRRRRESRLRGTFGPEYDRTVEGAGSKRAAAKELQDRKERHDELQIQPLDPASAQRYRDEWRLAQERFVDQPAESVQQAHDLLQRALQERGYPTRDQDERVAMLSVDHADVLDRYRTGMQTEQQWRSSGTTDTEDLRLAMQHYRAVFDRVVGETDGGTAAYPTDERTAGTGQRMTGTEQHSTAAEQSAPAAEPAARDRIE